MIILGISAFYHDSAAALLKDGEIVAAAHEERFTRKKHDPSFPRQASRFCLEYAGISLQDVDAVAFYDKPFLKFERLLETYYVFAPRGLRSFLSAVPVWIKEKLFLRRLIMEELAAFGQVEDKKINLLFSDHHLSHAASAFYPSPFENAAILTIDGVGEWATASIFQGKGREITPLKELRFPHSVGLLYSAFTYYLGFKVNSGEYKLMGLAPYGNPASDRVAHYKSLITTHLVDIKDDGSIFLNTDYFDYLTGLRMADDRKWGDLFGFPKKKPETEPEQHHCDLALAIQQVTEDIVIKMAKTAKQLTGASNLCLAGGVALNCVANSRLLEAGLFDDIWIQPAAGDAGGALGAAYAVYHQHYEQSRGLPARSDAMQGSYLGPEFDEVDIMTTAKEFQAVYTKYEDFNALCNVVSGKLAEGGVVGWCQGRMEWGPRALGNRSILGDARNADMQRKLNLKIKHREGFRPFAPSVLAEEAAEYFDIDRPTPYMLFTPSVTERRRKTLPDHYEDLPLKDKLYYVRSDLPAITHIDYSARVQTVHKDTNPKYWGLIEAFKNRTGYGVIINTSFNVRGEPIVCTPEDAYRCFMRTDMDYLVLGNYFFDKQAQKPLRDSDELKTTFELD